MTIDSIKDNLSYMLLFFVVLFITFYLNPSVDSLVGYAKELFIAVIWFVYLAYFLKRSWLFFGVMSFFSFCVFIWAEKISFESVGLTVLIAYAGLAMAINLVSVCVYQLPIIRSRLIKVLAVYFLNVSVVLIPLVFILYYISFSAVFAHDALAAIFQTNFMEVCDFLESNVPLSVLIATSIGLVLVFYFFYRQSFCFQKKNECWHLLIVSFVLMSMVWFLGSLRIYSFVWNGYHDYVDQLAVFKSLQSKHNQKGFSFTANKTEVGETYVVVIGESLNKNHMGVYGYYRNTTPKMKTLLQQGDLIKFEKAFSSHTHTVPVLQMALTQANQLNGVDFFKSPSIINIARKADFETYWISNQVRYGAFDNLVSLIGESTDNYWFVNGFVGDTVKSSVYDEAVIPYFKQIIDKPSVKNRLIFVHLMGSHESYCARVPKGKDRYFYKQIKGMSANKVRRINCYDNSVLYNDNLLSEIIVLLNTSQNMAALVYFSDHADDVDSGKAHQSALFTYDMTQIPLLVWLSGDYKAKYHAKVASMEVNRNKYFSNDLMFDFILGLLGVESDVYNSRYDLSNNDYHLGHGDLKTLHGQKIYASPDNPYFNPN